MPKLCDAIDGAAAGANRLEDLVEALSQDQRMRLAKVVSSALAADDDERIALLAGLEQALSRPA